MNQLTDYCGYDDALFVDEVPDYFFCIICHLVMRKPKQILSCGHKMCSECFKRYHAYSDKGKSTLVCPIDNINLKLEDVVPDVGTERLIGNLQVACSRKGDGCTWLGDLRDLVSHLEKCQFKAEEIAAEDISEKLQCLMEKVDKMEVLFLEKDKEIALLNFTQQELKKENDNLKTSFEDHQRNQQQVLEKGVEKEEKRIAEFGKLCEDKDKEIISLKEEMNTMKNDIINLQQKNMAKGKEVETEGKLKVSIPAEIQSQQNLKAFFLIEINGISCGKIIFNLFNSKAPKTCEKFISLCTHKYKVGYKNTRFQYIEPEEICGAGFKLMSNAGSEVGCPANLKTARENMTARHDRARLVTMDNDHNGGRPDCTGSYFHILFKPFHCADGQNVIFAEITKETWSVMKKIRKVNPAHIFTRQQEIKIVDCGVE